MAWLSAQVGWKRPRMERKARDGRVRQCGDVEIGGGRVMTGDGPEVKVWGEKTIVRSWEAGRPEI